MDGREVSALVIPESCENLNTESEGGRKTDAHQNLPSASLQQDAMPVRKQMATKQRLIKCYVPNEVRQARTRKPAKASQTV